MLVTVLLTLPLVMTSALIVGNTNDCEVYEAELRSYPDLSRRVVTSSLPLPPDYIITEVQQDLAKGRSFYWCEMKVKHGEGLKIYRHFGHNGTMWWVTKGCGGWFHITACRTTTTTTTTTTNTANDSRGSSAEGGDNNNNNVDPYQTPTIVTIVTAQGDKDREKMGATKPADSVALKDPNRGSLWSMYHWLAEQRTPLHEKLGDIPNRVARSVDEEFAAEFGYD
ncbi:hypothetical protein ACOMHN_052568 [Nucella lapillus]